MKRIYISLLLIFTIIQSYGQEKKWHFKVVPTISYISQNIEGRFMTEPFTPNSEIAPRSYQIDYNKSFHYSQSNIGVEAERGINQWSLAIGLQVEIPHKTTDFINDNEDFTMNVDRGLNYISYIKMKRDLNIFTLYGKLGYTVYSGISINADRENNGEIDWHDHNFGGMLAGIGIEKNIVSKLNLLVEGTWNKYSMEQPLKDEATSKETVIHYGLSIGVTYTIW
ncbi:MAG: hypothetical protein N4A37_12070 [Prolixibacteraceae bacterium]|jgi:hypothetical protein|nr:hypothetical protein [Prolixibacteraceae bacterium]